MNCPYCKTLIPPHLLAQSFAAMGGSVKSKAKTEAARINGAKGAAATKARWERLKKQKEI